jgi:excisionase family DNA binding protein
MDIEKRRWLKISEAAEYLSMHPKSLYRACSQRKVPHCKAAGLGIRIDRIKLDAMLETLAVGPKELGKSLK